MRTAKRMLLVAALVLPLLPLTACQREEASQKIAIKGKIFIFNVRLARAYVEVTLDRKDGVPDGAMVTATFENPAGGKPLVASQKVFPAMTRIDLQSPDMACIRKDRPYAITITLEDPSGKTLQTIETSLASTLDQTVMPAQALVKGPAYDANPEAKGADGKFILRDNADCPA